MTDQRGMTSTARPRHTPSDDCVWWVIFMKTVQSRRPATLTGISLTLKIHKSTGRHLFFSEAAIYSTVSFLFFTFLFFIFLHEKKKRKVASSFLPCAHLIMNSGEFHMGKLKVKACSHDNLVSCRSRLFCALIWQNMASIEDTLHVCHLDFAFLSKQNVFIKLSLALISSANPFLEAILCGSK